MFLALRRAVGGIGTVLEQSNLSGLLQLLDSMGLQDMLIILTISGCTLRYSSSCKRYFSSFLSVYSTAKFASTRIIAV